MDSVRVDVPDNLFNWQPDHKAESEPGGDIVKLTLADGQTLIEKIEDTYVAFRKAIERLVLNNTCRCNACANSSNLELKFFIMNHAVSWLAEYHLDST